ncbi:cytidine deaminase [Jeotgalibaca ciconiae]|uniref:Cytidine deaminase n=1 Tax=Jeotgalibaca ciconiae TaxID=2496265 RepID=A0A3Q9BNV2_9LACT|nr:cytidine deaminase [Jeotgalibaca ciconiae]AZP05626.1 cytidine deaminase [Jeotgalibaca ciconiae]HJB23364.1 cytidine deaminase [Candidatus Jeotgalibaca pullicola]
MKENQVKSLVEKAKEIKEKAYVPYSHFPVGAAILYKDNQVIQGVNVENVSFGATNCAERTALFTGITRGYSKDDVVAIAVSANTKDYITPCSICRQVMVELCQADTPVYLTNGNDEIKKVTVEELVPFAFSTMDN